MKYSFKFRPNTCADRIYGGAYQGIGVSLTTFGDKKQLGDPFSFYVFQGARIARFSPRASLNYEWNFGLSAGWKPYDNYYNSYNGAVGSRMNAYINAGVYINWAFSRYFDLGSGSIDSGIREFSVTIGEVREIASDNQIEVTGKRPVYVNSGIDISIHP